MGFAKRSRKGKGSAKVTNVTEAVETKESTETKDSAPAAKETSKTAPPAPSKAGGKKKKGGMADLFSETVPEQILDDFSSNTPFVISRNGEKCYVGVLIKAADMGGLDKKSSSKNADKGQLVQQLNSGAIVSYFTPQLLQDEEIVIVPNAQSMANIEEFGIIRTIPWSYVYVNTDGDIEKADIETSFDEISNILKGTVKITDRVDGSESDGSNTSTPASTSSNDDEFEDEIMSEDEYNEQNDYSDEEYEYESDYEEDGPPASDFDDENSDIDNGGYDDYEDDYQYNEPEDYSANVDYSDDEAGEQYTDDSQYDDSNYGYGYDNNDDYDTSVDMNVGPDDGIEIPYDDVYAEIIRKFYSDELGLEVSTAPFDSQFMHGNDIAFFEEGRPEGWLNNYLNEMSRAANIELYEMHQSNLYKMKEHYLTAMAKHCEAIQKELDTKDRSTQYGQMDDMLRKRKADDTKQIDDLVAQRKQELNQKWEQELEAAADQGALDAKNRHRDRFGKQHEQDLLQIGPSIRDEIEMSYQMALRDMNAQRKSEALKRLDYSINETLQEVSELYLEMLEAEHQKHKELEQGIKDFLDDHRKDDVARSEALAEELRQSQKADQIMAECTAKIANMNAEFENNKLKMQDDIERMQRENDLALQSKEDEWSRRLTESEAAREDQKQEINHLLEKYTALDAQKAQEFSARINELKNEKDAWEDKCNHIIATNKHSNTATIFLTIIAVICALAIGFIAGEFASLKSNQIRTNEAIIQEYEEKLNGLEEQNKALIDAQSQDASTEESTEKSTEK